MIDAHANPMLPEQKRKCFTGLHRFRDSIPGEQTVLWALEGENGLVDPEEVGEADFPDCGPLSPSE